MRWTNYFIHPGDNRYYVFAFKEDEHADVFEIRLKDTDISYERHYEQDETTNDPSGEWLFGVHRKYFKEALNANHLVHAEFRTKFIPVQGLRWALLIGTLAAVMLAVIGALTQHAQAQSVNSKKHWYLSLTGTYLTPLQALGAESITASDEGLELTWNPKGGSSFGVRLERQLQSAWSIGTGLEVLRTWSDWEMAFQPEFGIPPGPPTTLHDTLSLRTSRYRIPLMIRTSVPLNVKSRLTASAGISLDFLLSDVYSVGFQALDSIYSDYLIEENRQHRLTAPLRAELGYEFTPQDRNKLGWYIGVLWWREWSSNRWGEATWTRLLETADVRLYLGQAAFGAEIRLILP